MADEPDYLPTQMQFHQAQEAIHHAEIWAVVAHIVPVAVYEVPARTSIEKLRQAAATLGFDLVRRVEGDLRTGPTPERDRRPPQPTSVVSGMRVAPFCELTFRTEADLDQFMDWLHSK